MIRRVFGCHDGVTSRATEGGGVHVLDAAVRSRANNQEVDDGGEADPLQGTAHHGQAQVDGGENSRQFPAHPQTSPSEPDADRNQQQAQHKDSREDQKNQKTDVRMRRPGQEDVIEPEGNGGERRARGDDCAHKASGILSQKINWLRPVSDSFSQAHWELPLNYC